MQDIVKKVTITHRQGFKARPFTGKLIITKNKIKYDLVYNKDLFIMSSPVHDVRWEFPLVAKEQKQDLSAVFAVAARVNQDFVVPKVLDGEEITVDVLFGSGAKKSIYQTISDKIEPYTPNLRQLATFILRLVPDGYEAPTYLEHQNAEDVCGWKVEELIELINKYKGTKLQEEIVGQIINALSMIFEPDYFYTDNLHVLNKPIEELDFEEVKTYITYIYRRERIASGYIEEYVSNGKLRRLLERSISLYNENSD